MDQERFTDEAADANVDCSFDSEIALRVMANDRLFLTWVSAISQYKEMVLGPFTLDDGCHGIIFVRQGELHLEIDGQPLVVSEGQSLVLKPGEQVISTPQESDIFCPWLAFRLDRSEARAHAEGIQIKRVARTRDVLRLQELFTLLAEDYTESRLPNEYWPVYNRSSQYLLMSLLSRLESRESEAPVAATGYELIAERAKQYVRMHLPDDLSSDTVARALDCSSGYLRWAFRKAFSEGLADFVFRQRMQRARYMLVSQPRALVYEIARQCGYDNFRHFTTVFRRFHRMTPSEYRAANLHSRVDANI